MAKKTEWKPAESMPARSSSNADVKVEPITDGYLVSIASRNIIAPGATWQADFGADAGPWKGRTFSVSHEMAHKFVLVHMHYAMQNFVPPEGIPCTLISDGVCKACRRERCAAHLTDDWPTVYPGSTLRIAFKNVSDTPSHLRATMEGMRATIPGYGPPFSGL